jgi:hypothetical protein
MPNMMIADLGTRIEDAPIAIPATHLGVAAAGSQAPLQG